MFLLSKNLLLLFLLLPLLHLLRRIRIRIIFKPFRLLLASEANSLIVFSDLGGLIDFIALLELPDLVGQVLPDHVAAGCLEFPEADQDQVADVDPHSLAHGASDPGHPLHAVHAVHFHTAVAHHPQH
jgi:hypothetical protein